MTTELDKQLRAALDATQVSSDEQVLWAAVVRKLNELETRVAELTRECSHKLSPYDLSERP